MRTYTAIIAAAGLLLAGCGDTDSLSAGSDPSPAEPTAEDTEPSEDDEPEPESPEPQEQEPVEDVAPESDDQAKGQLLVDLNSPVVWEEAGVRVAVTGIGFTSLDSPVVDKALLDFVEDDTQTIISLDVTVSNDAGEPVNVYANQGTIQIGRTQQDAAPFLSDSFAGEMNDGVDDDGLVLFEMSEAYDELVGEGTLLYEAPGPSSAETYEGVADDVAITVEWDA